MICFFCPQAERKVHAELWRRLAAFGLTINPEKLIKNLGKDLPTWSWRMISLLFDVDVVPS